MNNNNIIILTRIKLKKFQNKKKNYVNKENIIKLKQIKHQGKNGKSNIDHIALDNNNSDNKIWNYIKAKHYGVSTTIQSIKYTKEQKEDRKKIKSKEKPIHINEIKNKKNRE